MLHLKRSLMLLMSGVGSLSALSHSSENWGVHALRRVWAISSGSVRIVFHSRVDWGNLGVGCGRCLH